MRTRLSASILLISLAVATTAAAQSVSAAVVLNGGEVRPVPVMTGAVGAGVVQIDLTAGTATFDVAVFNIAGAITAAHLHLGAAGMVGPVLFDCAPFRIRRAILCCTARSTAGA